MSQQLDPHIVKEIKRQFEILQFGTVEITPEDEFKKMLGQALVKNQPLRVKCGIDPTASDVHLGHLVPYGKMREFQDLGHTGVVVIGDYTAQIGDPTGKTESRPTLTAKQTQENAEKYMEQVFKVLDPNKTEVRYQSEWFANIGLVDVMSWAQQTTVAKLISHDTFRKRLEENNPLGLHELFYPVLQGIDSVFIKADVELGGSDQKFNVLMGRDYQKNAGLRPQIAILLPIITGICGTQKMSKSLNNYIGVLDQPFDQFGKVMSIPDKLMPEYAKYTAGFSSQVCEQFIKELDSGRLHPNEAKKQLAQAIIARLHNKATAIEMRQQFEQVFAKKQLPDDIPEFKISENQSILDVMSDSNLVTSKAEARRMIAQGGVSFVDGEKISSAEFIVSSKNLNQVLKVGKRRFLKLK